MLILVNVEHEIFYERRYYVFWKGVITPFEKALLRLFNRHYYAYLKGVLRLFMHKRRNNAFSLRVITPFSRYYAFKKGVITPFHFFSLRNLKLIGFRRMKTTRTPNFKPHPSQDYS